MIVRFTRTNGLAFLVVAWVSVLVTTPVVGQELKVNDVVDQGRLRQRYVFNVALRPGGAINIEPGLGVDMSDPLSLNIKADGPFDLKVKKDPSFLGERKCEFTQTNSVQAEATMLSTYFNAAFPFVSAKAAYDKADRTLKTSSVFYIVLRDSTGGAVYTGRPKWTAAPEIGEDVDPNKQLKMFLHHYGSHVITKVYYGRQIIIRAELASREQEQVEDVKAALSAGFGGFGGDIGIHSIARTRLQQGDISISACVVGGKIEPPQADALLVGFDAVHQFVKNYNAGKIQIEPGPIAIDLESYWYTLGQFPEVQKLLESDTKFIAEADIAPLAKMVGDRLTEQQTSEWKVWKAGTAVVKVAGFIGGYEVVKLEEEIPEGATILATTRTTGNAPRERYKEGVLGPAYKVATRVEKDGFLVMVEDWGRRNFNKDVTVDWTIIAPIK